MEFDGSVRVAGAVAESITDGPGLRYTLFLQGCPHGCAGCHNPETHDFRGGEDRFLRDIWTDIRRNPLLSGVTLSGGEPFEQAREIIPLAREIRAAGIELAAYSGYTFEQLLSGGGDRLELLQLCNVLVDGAYIKERRNLSLRFRGSENQRIIDVAAGIAAGGAVLIHDGRWQD